jgi:hypothetical protein
MRLRNALTPIATLAGLSLPALVGGALAVETIFSWPGMGRLAMQAVATRDYPVILATTAMVRGRRRARQFAGGRRVLVARPAGAALMSVVRRIWNDRAAAAGALLIAAFALAALFAPVIAPHDPTALGDLAAGAYRPPGAGHWLGTDQFGRDDSCRASSMARAFRSASLSSPRPSPSASARASVW